MKRISYIILFAVAFLLVACTKRPELKVYKLEFVTETVEKTNSTAKMTVEYSYPTELESVKVILSENSDLGGAVSKEASITEKTFVAEFNDLKQGTKYHYCYEYSNGISLLKTDVKSFETDDVEVALPSVNTVEVKEVMSMSAVAVGNVSSDGGSVITSRGFCWSKTANPTVQNCCVEVSGTTGAFEGSLTGLEANTKYHVRAYAVNSKGTSYGEQKSFTTNGEIGGHYYVDLGLPSGLLWATCNVGADSPDDYGWYFMWGSVTEGGDPDCSLANCPGNGGSSNYNSSAIAAWDASHLTGNVLNPDVDAASVNWGDDWRMPTKDEWKELKDRCTWTWTTQGGENGYRVTGLSGRSIFLPAAGRRNGTSLYNAGSYGFYWSSSLYSSIPSGAYYMYFNSGGVNPQDYLSRYYGCTVRPVRPAL